MKIHRMNAALLPFACSMRARSQALIIGIVLKNFMTILSLSTKSKMLPIFEGHNNNDFEPKSQEKLS